VCTVCTVQMIGLRETLPFPSLSFPFLSFPFLSFPFLSDFPTCQEHREQFLPESAHMY